MRLSLLFSLLLTAAACGTEPEPAPAPPSDTTTTVDPVSARQTVYDVVAANPSLSTFASLAETAGLADVLRDTAEVYTVFAPSNAAFGALDADTLAALRAAPTRLRSRLLAHVLTTRMLSGDIFGELTIESVVGSNLALDADAEDVTVGDDTGTSATVTDADLDAENGVVHVIDAVLAGPAQAPAAS